MYEKSYESVSFTVWPHVFLTVAGMIVNFGVWFAISTSQNIPIYFKHLLKPVNWNNSLWISLFLDTFQKEYHKWKTCPIKVGQTLSPFNQRHFRFPKKSTKLKHFNLILSINRNHTRIRHPKSQKMTFLRDWPQFEF